MPGSISTDEDWFQDDIPRPRTPYVESFELSYRELKELAEDYRVWAIVGILPGYEIGPKDPVPKNTPGRRRPHGSVSGTGAYRPGRTPKVSD